jgi:hypothetical protein
MANSIHALIYNIYKFIFSSDFPCSHTLVFIYLLSLPTSFTHLLVVLYIYIYIYIYISSASGGWLGTCCRYSTVSIWNIFSDLVLFHTLSIYWQTAQAVQKVSYILIVLVSSSLQFMPKLALITLKSRSELLAKCHWMTSKQLIWMSSFPLG